MKKQENTVLKFESLSDAHRDFGLPNPKHALIAVINGAIIPLDIHDKLIEKAKEKLSTTRLSVSEVAYTLGFEHSQSFSKLFKIKTNLSPLEFRRTFN